MIKRGNGITDSPDRLNVIVEGTKIIGDLITDSNIRIDGEVKGNVSAGAKVVIGKTGKIQGNLNCLDADIEGNLEGILKVDNLLSLRSTANVVGEITTSKIQIEEGANFSGNCKMSTSYTKDTFAKTEKLVEQEDIVY